MVDVQGGRSGWTFRVDIQGGRSGWTFMVDVDGGRSGWMVRDVRNAVMHSAKFEVTSADLTAYLTTMTTLLQEPAVHKYASARRGIVEINKIETLSLDVNAAAVNQLERSMWKAMVEEQTSNKQDIQKAIESNEDLKKRLGDVYTKLTADIALLRESDALSLLKCDNISSER
ncbi:hypothetical protein LSAT2_009802 [Lamellibrachia satsuma]|nr:hypothetical protein LSAT2_009802 [Lamellibrachia satsuma]